MKLIKLITPSIFSLLLACGQKGHPATQNVDALRDMYSQKLNELKSASQGWPSEVDCDAALWAGEARRGGADWVDMAKAIQPNGRPTRQPNKDCGPPPYGTNNSAATTSNDMMVGIILGLEYSRDVDSLKKLWSYGSDHNWIMGYPENELGRVLFRQSGVGILAQAIYKISGEDHPQRIIPNPPIPVNADYEEHIQILATLTEIDLGRRPILPVTCSSRLDDALIQAVCGSSDKAAGLLIGDYQYPTYVRGSENYKLVHWLIAAKIALGE